VISTSSRSSRSTPTSTAKKPTAPIFDPATFSAPGYEAQATARSFLLYWEAALGGNCVTTAMQPAMIIGLVEAATAFWDDRATAALAALGVARLEHLRSDMLRALLGELDDGRMRLGRLAKAEAAARRVVRLAPGETQATLGILNHCAPPAPRKVREAHDTAASCVAFCEARGFRFNASRLRLRQAGTICLGTLGRSFSPNQLRPLISAARRDLDACKA
jgi:hypothetical protein